MTVEDAKDLMEIKARHKIPVHLQSCHTAMVDGYVVEGHVPREAIMRMLQEQPDIIGLSVPGMPVGSPGMESEDGKVEPYQVLAIDRQGNTRVFATYPQ